MTDPLVLASIPQVIGLLKDIQQARVDIGVDPTKWAVTVPAALLKLEASAVLLLPPEIQAVTNAGFGVFDAKIAATIAALEAKQAAG